MKGDGSQISITDLNDEQNYHFKLKAAPQGDALTIKYYRSVTEVATDPECWSRLRNDAMFFLVAGSGTGVKNLLKTKPRSGVIFIFSSRCLHGLYNCNFLTKKIFVFRLQRW